MVKTSVKKLAYGINREQLPDYSLYRLNRGHLFKRAGNPVTVVPQFKGVQIVTQTITVTASTPQTPAQKALTTFTNPTTPTTVQWPIVRR